MTTAKECLEHDIAAYDTLGFPNHGILERMTLEYGQEWTGTKWTSFRGTGLRRKPLRRCFANCLEYSISRDDVSYCEGYAYCGALVCHHAWLLYEGRVCDPTWRHTIQEWIPENEWSYVGVEIDTTALMSYYVRSWSGSFLTIIAENRLDLADFIVREEVAA